MALSIIKILPLNWALLGYYAASNGNSVPTFRENVSVPFSRVKKPKKSTETSVKDYHCMLRNTPEERRCHQYRGGSLKILTLIGIRKEDHSILLYVTHMLYLNSLLLEYV
jgi:hypothetical protein